MAIKNRQVLQFYADPKIIEKKEFPITQQYLDKLREGKELSLDKKSNQKNYVGMALTFMGQNKIPQTKDKCFLEALQDRDKEGTLFGEKGMKALSFLDKSFVDDNNFAKCRSFVFLENLSDIYCAELQKWHLYISWAAGCESGCFDTKHLNLESSSGFTSFMCPELLLWMCEATKSEMTEYFYNELLKIEAGDAKTVFRQIQSDWAPRVRREIERIISLSGTEERFTPEKEKLS